MRFHASFICDSAKEIGGLRCTSDLELTTSAQLSSVGNLDELTLPGEVNAEAEGKKNTQAASDLRGWETEEFISCIISSKLCIRS